MKYLSRVVKGKGRGRGLGFPTFNLVIPAHFDLETGVYAAWVWIENKRYAGALHFGPIPTFQEMENNLEIFVLDYHDWETVDELTFEPVDYLRPVRTFTTADDLKEQIARDVRWVRETLS
ncbi:riboflavin kinase [Patescibacteria group bacterium]|nr:riboflavin kinase [Patescibacteria group bacterium]